MQMHIKLEAHNYIKNNCKYYKQYFYNRDFDNIIKRTMKILENKLLPINAFCFYINYCFGEMSKDSLFYLALSKQKRKNLEFYHKAIIKIRMHIDSIFNEIDRIKKYK